MRTRKIESSTRTREIVLVAVLTLAFITTSLIAWRADSATVTDVGYFTETALTTDGAKDPHYLPNSTAICTIWGTWDGAEVSMVTDIQGTEVTRPVGAPPFDSATFDVPFTQFAAGAGTYYLIISSAGASTSLNFHCRWSRVS